MAVPDKLRIAVFHNLPSGGAKRTLHEVVKRLSKRGHLIDLYTLDDKDEWFLPPDSYCNKVYRFPQQRKKLIGRRIPLVTQYLNLTCYLSFIHRVKKQAKEIAKKIDEGGYDLTYVDHCKHMRAPFVLRYLKTPAVYYCHEPSRELYEPMPFRGEEYLKYSRRPKWLSRLSHLYYLPMNIIYGLIRKSYERRNTRAAKIVLVNSEFSRKKVKKAYGVDALVHYWGVDEGAFAPLPLKKKEFVLSVGSLTPLKGFDFLVDSISLVPRDRRPRLKIVCNFSSPLERGYLAARASNSGVDVEIQERINEKELLSLYNEALAFVYSPHGEPFGLAVLEAMACGLCVLAVREGGYVEAIKDNETGVLVERAADLFANSLERLLSEESTRKRIGENARKQVLANWTFEQSIASLEKHLLLLAGKANLQMECCSIIIPNYNGKEYLKTYLPSVLEATAFDGRAHEVIVVDDGSEDGSVEFLKNSFPNVRVLPLGENRGFSFACNSGAQAARNEILVFLNSDMKVSRDFVSPLTVHFHDREVFAVAPKILRPELDMANESITRASFIRGIVHWGYPGMHTCLPARQEPLVNFNRTVFIFYACGGAAAIDKKKFMELGGFDSLYHPFYVEDVDLSYRAWKRGWKVLYEPKSVAHHYRGTIGKYYDERSRRAIRMRNIFLFIWKNITSPVFTLEHIFFLPSRLLRAAVMGDYIFVHSFIRALARLPRALAKRFSGAGMQMVMDEEIFRKVAIDADRDKWRASA